MSVSLLTNIRLLSINTYIQRLQTAADAKDKEVTMRKGTHCAAWAFSTRFELTKTFSCPRYQSPQLRKLTKGSLLALCAHA